MMTKRRWILAGAAVFTLLGCVALAAWFKDWQSWMAYETGSRNTNGTPPNYNYWSGFGSVFPWSMTVVVSVLGLLYHNLKKNNCHTHGCWRIGSYPVGQYKVCKPCHFKVTGSHPTIEHIQKHHRWFLSA